MTVFTLHPSLSLSRSYHCSLSSPSLPLLSRLPQSPFSSLPITPSSLPLSLLLPFPSRCCVHRCPVVRVPLSAPHHLLKHTHTPSPFHPPLTPLTSPSLTHSPSLTPHLTTNTLTLSPHFPLTSSTQAHSHSLSYSPLTSPSLHPHYRHVASCLRLILCELFFLFIFFTFMIFFFLIVFF